MPPEQGVLPAALSFLERGRHLLPVLPDKTPNLDLIEVTRGERRWAGLRDEPATAAELETWASLDPKLGIGVICLNGLAVADVDHPDDDTVPEFPATAVASTSRPGGRHYYFAAIPDQRARTFSWGELRADGCYVVAPPTVSANGVSYRWLSDPDELAELPDVLRERVRAQAAAPPDYLFSLRNSVLSRESLEQLDTREDVVRRLCGVLSVPQDLSLGRAFRCVLHDDVKPSATLRRTDNGTILYHCFAGCGPGRRSWFPLAEVRARQAGRRVFRLGRVELALWKLDLLERAGLVEPVRFDGCAPLELRPVFDGFLRLLGLRWLTTPGSPTPFARAFAAPWCGLTETDLRAGFAALRELGLIRPAGTDAQGLSLWFPGEGVSPIA